MHRFPAVAEDRSEDRLQAELEIPRPFLRAFEPSLLERIASAVRGWLDSQRERAWLPRSVDPVTELKHVWLGEYGLAPDLNPPSARHAQRARW